MAAWDGRWGRVRDGLWQIWFQKGNQKSIFLFWVDSHMKFKRDSGLLSLGRHAAWMMLAALPVAPSMAATELQVWHDHSAYNSESFEDLVKDYNRSQSDVRVSLRRFGHPADQIGRAH